MKKNILTFIILSISFVYGQDNEDLIKEYKQTIDYIFLEKFISDVIDEYYTNDTLYIEKKGKHFKMKILNKNVRFLDSFFDIKSSKNKIHYVSESDLFIGEEDCNCIRKIYTVIQLEKKPFSVIEKIEGIKDITTRKERRQKKGKYVDVSIIKSKNYYCMKFIENKFKVMYLRDCYDHEILIGD